MGEEHRAAENATIIVTTPNHRFDRSAQQLRRWVPVALRAPAPGQAKRSAALETRSREASA
jgi:hypothetical protein